MILYYILKILGSPFFYLLFLPKVIGRKHTRLKGKGIVICNHISLWDPLFISVVFRRQIYWMGKIELFKNKLARAFFLLVRAFPVRRGEGDLSAIRHSFKLLRAGKIFGIFPEGTRMKGGKLRKFEPGTSIIALKSGAPIIPIYIKGKYTPFRRMKMIIGEPFELADYVGSKTDTGVVAAATELLENKLKDLRDSSA